MLLYSNVRPNPHRLSNAIADHAPHLWTQVDTSPLMGWARSPRAESWERNDGARMWAELYGQHHAVVDVALEGVSKPEEVNEALESTLGSALTVFQLERYSDVFDPEKKNRLGRVEEREGRLAVLLHRWQPDPALVSEIPENVLADALSHLSETVPMRLMFAALHAKNFDPTRLPIAINSLKVLSSFGVPLADAQKLYREFPQIALSDLAQAHRSGAPREYLLHLA